MGGLHPVWRRDRQHTDSGSQDPTAAGGSVNCGASSARVPTLVLRSRRVSQLAPHFREQRPLQVESVCSEPICVCNSFNSLV